MGVMQITRRADSPLVAERARNHASGTPKRQDKSAAIIDVCNEINTASRVDFCDNIWPKSDHGTRTKMDNRGSATKSAATAATIFNEREIRCGLTAPKNRISVAT